MRYFEARVQENRRLGGGYFALDLVGCEALERSEPGQFVMVRGDWERDPLLPRAFSLLSAGAGGRASILAKTVGRGTALLERCLPGASLHILGPLGTRFPSPSPEYVDLLVGGGVGIPPLFMQAARAADVQLGPMAEIIYGGRTAQDLVLLDEMRRFGTGLHLATEDGSVGFHGLVTGLLEQRLAAAKTAGRTPRILACGPNGMLWAVGRLARAANAPCFLSLEEQMACGIGVCLGCAIPARSRPFRYVCKDGPVFDATDVLDVGGEGWPATAPGAGPGSCL